MAFFFLLYYQGNKEQSAYKDAIRLTIQQGGDTDTNACIVGGMMGALMGIKKIPSSMVDTLLSFDCALNGRNRP